MLWNKILTAIHQEAPSPRFFTPTLTLPRQGGGNRGLSQQGGGNAGLPRPSSAGLWQQGGWHFRVFGRTLTIFCSIIIFLFYLRLTIYAEGGPPFKEGDVLALTQCLEIALKNQPTLKAARSSVEANQARVTQSRADYLPQISLHSAYDRVHTGFSSRFMSAGQATSNYSAGVKLTQLFYD
ncbi:MAG: TolC family protein, partial [Deltaproteobacteria bacterium]|nr:TolC family protein [Deltaproteobacteria bacterium]